MSDDQVIKPFSRDAIVTPTVARVSSGPRYQPAATAGEWFCTYPNGEPRHRHESEEAMKRCPFQPGIKSR